MRPRTRPFAGLFLLFVLLGLAFGCRQEVPPLFRRNQLPETTLTIVPEDSTQGLYRYHVYWHGEDPDGRVVRYIFAITDTISRNEEENWDPNLAIDKERSRYTEKTDSIFIFDSARGRQTFNIAAIDDYGKADRTPARAFFRISDYGLPKVEFLSVYTFRDTLVDDPIDTCVGAAPCTIPNYTNFAVRFTGTTGNGYVTGFQWQSVRPGQTNPEAFQPMGTDTLFLTAGTDQTGRDFFGRPTWRLEGSVVTAFYYSSREDSIASGNFTFRSRVRDLAKRESLLRDGVRRVVINYDPDSQIFRMPYCDCPNAPDPCTRTDLVRAGFIVGIDNPNQSSWRDTMERWVPFCEGDTLPLSSHLRFFVRGHDDGRDQPKDPGAGLRDVGYSYRFQWHDGPAAHLSMPFSREYAPMDLQLPPAVGSIAWPKGGLKGWGDEAGASGVCPFDFTFFAAAVDEHGKRDGTPDSIAFYVSGTPKLDRLEVDDRVTNPPDTLVVVFIPACRQEVRTACPDTSTTTNPAMRFGPDTLKVFGTFAATCSSTTDIHCRYNPGINRFTFPFEAYGHDHPRDWDWPTWWPPGQRRYQRFGENAGRIRSWRFSFECLSPPDRVCDDLAIPGESDWRTDVQNPATDPPPWTQVFDEAPRVDFRLDSLCVTSRPNPNVPCFDLKMHLPPEKLGLYRYTVEGRDVESIPTPCKEVSDLNPTASLFDRNPLGRQTQTETRYMKWVQYSDVRPWLPRPPSLKSAWDVSRKKVSR